MMPSFSSEVPLAHPNSFILFAVSRAWVTHFLTGYSATRGRLAPGHADSFLVWDATVTDTLAASYLANTSTTSGAAAEAAATRKQAKYQELSNMHVFIKLALETLGPINNTGIDFISDLACDLTLSTGDPRETSFLFQQLSISVQRFNAVAFRGTFTDSENRDYKHRYESTDTFKLPEGYLLCNWFQ